MGILTARDMSIIWQSSSEMEVPEGEAAESVWRARFCSSRLMGRWPGTTTLAETEAARAVMRSWEYILLFLLLKAYCEYVLSMYRVSLDQSEYQVEKGEGGK